MLAAEAAAKSEQMRNVQTGAQVRNFLRGLTGAQQRDDVDELARKNKQLADDLDAQKKARVAAEAQLENMRRNENMRISETQKRERELDDREAKLKPQPALKNDRNMTENVRRPKL